MSTDENKQKLENRFFNLFSEFLENCKETWPDDVELKQASITYNTAMLLPSNKKIALNEWKNHLLRPCEEYQPENVKIPYAKAFKNLTSKPITIDAILFYKDYDLALKLLDEYESEYISVKMHPKYTEGDPQTRKVIKTVVETLCQISKEIFDVSCDYPSKVDIKKNIASRQAPPASETTMGDAVKTVVLSVIEEICPGGSKHYENLDDKDTKICEKAWQSLSSPPAKEAIRKKNLNKFLKKTNLDPLKKLDLNPDTIVSKDFWLCLERLESMKMVNNIIPSSMMGKIEKEAARIMESVNEGGNVFENLNIMEIGERVLESCEEGELEMMAEKMPDMLPTIMNMTQGLPDEVKGSLNPSMLSQLSMN